MERRRSPPKHRHDGTSPLPLGMDWSPPPKKWNGRDTVWPHDPRTGWSYCITIPTWVVLPKSKDSDPVVFYRVVVGLQSPEGVTTTRAVLRRFNDFLRLLAALRKAFPQKNLPPAPPKGLLRLKSRTLLEERRCALEEWMTKLLSDIDMSRSIVVASFLELESAARSSFQDENPQIVQGNHSASNSLESMASGSIPVTPDYGSDTAYETSEIGTSSVGRDNVSEAGTEDLSLDEDLTGPLEKLVKHGMSNIDEGLLMGNAILEQVEGYPRHHTIHSREINRGGDKNGNGRGDYVSEKQQGKLIGNSKKLLNGTSSLPDMEFSSSLADDNSITSSDINLVLPLGQQQKLNRVLISMQRRLGTAKTDMEDVISRLNQEIAVKDYLMTKVKDLEEELETTKLRSKENLHQAILMERERVTQMQWDMEELRRKSLEMEFKLKSQQDDNRETEPPKTSVIEEKDKLLQELDDTKNKFEQLLKKHQELEVKSKADIKVLVKEVKSLRNSQADLKQQLNQSLVGKSEAEKLLQEEKQKFEEKETARVNLLHEFDVLQHRLRECSINLLNESEDKLIIDSPSMQDALEIIKISDGHIEALLAQVQIIAQDDASTAAGDMKDEDGDNTSSHKLRKMLSEVLVDNINLRRQGGRGADYATLATRTHPETAPTDVGVLLFPPRSTQICRSLSSSRAFRVKIYILLEFNNTRCYKRSKAVAARAVAAAKDAELMEHVTRISALELDSGALKMEVAELNADKATLAKECERLCIEKLSAEALIAEAQVAQVDMQANLDWLMSSCIQGCIWDEPTLSKSVARFLSKSQQHGAKKGFLDGFNFYLSGKNIEQNPFQNIDTEA